MKRRKRADAGRRGCQVAWLLCMPVLIGGIAFLSLLGRAGPLGGFMPANDELLPLATGDATPTRIAAAPTKTPAATAGTAAIRPTAETTVTEETVSTPSSTPSSEPTATATIEPMMEPSPTSPPTIPPTPTSRPAPRGWAWYTDEEGRFTVLMPGKPEQRKGELVTEAGETELTIELVVVPEGSYAVGYGDYSVWMAEGEAEAILEGARDGALASVGGTATYERDIVLDGGHPGKEVGVALAEMDASMWMRVYLVDGRLYELMVLYANQTPISPEEAALFFDSFSVIR